MLLHPVPAGTPAAWRGKPRPSKTWQGFYYLEPRDLDALESPLLLHPYGDEDPADHLVFGDRGTIAAREGSALGRNSIEVFNLAAGDLCTARQQAQEAAHNAFLMALGLVGQGVDLKSRIAAARKMVEAGYAAADKGYSAAVRDYLHLFQMELGRGD